jgi:hypothetical protein
MENSDSLIDCGGNGRNQAGDYSPSTSFME